MARIHLDGIAHAYMSAPAHASDYALRQIDHIWEDGGAYALLGPSGCGKTTLLNVISGLIHPTRGHVRFDERDVTELPTERRNIAQVFQFPVIYDTMTVYDNLAFPLRNRGADDATVRARVSEVAEALDLTRDLGRRAQGLGADAKQKISLGRGLVRSDVAAILFDEPLTVIDPHLKWHLRRKLKEIHEHLKLTLIYVTHDQNEALTMADRVAVMHAGQVVQFGTPQELFETPRHTFVGYFIGTPGMNLLPCALGPGGAMVDGEEITLDPGLAEKASAAGGTLELGIRPQFLGLAAKSTPGGVPVRVAEVEDLGAFKIVTARLGGQAVKIKVSQDAEIPAEHGYVTFPPERTKLYADGRLVE